MKTYSIISLIGAIALGMGGCSTAYQAQTPDAVYYSPSQNNAGYSSSSDNNQSTEPENDNPNAGSYVTYQDGYNNSGNYSYLNGYNTPAMSLYDDPDNLYAYNSSLWASPLMYGSYYYPGSLSLGLGYSPFLWSYPSLSLGFGLGYSWMNPWLGSWYNPYAFGGWYSPLYSPYLIGGYYGGGYGYYGSDKLGTYSPRPASAYGPRMSGNSRVYIGAGNSSNHSSGAARLRNFSNTVTGSAQTPVNRLGAERVFTTNPNERPRNVNTNTRVAEKRPSIFRVFRKNTNVVERSRTNQEVFRPQQERTFNKPERTFENQTPRVEVSTPSFHSSPQSSPVRTFSPRGR